MQEKMRNYEIARDDDASEEAGSRTPMGQVLRDLTRAVDEAEKQLALMLESLGVILLPDRVNDTLHEIPKEIEESGLTSTLRRVVEHVATLAKRLDAVRGRIDLPTEL